jgi:death on curing protein
MPTSSRDYLTVSDILGIYSILMQRYGGASGIRDKGALEAAIFRPQSGYYTDVFQEAAALMESLATNHPFIDGNKRIAFAAADVFLRINGWRLVGEPLKFHDEIITMIETKSFILETLTPWLRDNAKSTSP